MEISETVKPKTASRLLIVDDEAEICDFISFVAKALGYQVTWSDHAEQFPTLYNDDFSVIILDLAMPGMDGIELIRFLAARHCQAAVILVSGFDEHVLASARELASARGLKVMGSLTKPIAMNDLKVLLLKARSSAISPAFGHKSNHLPTLDELRNAIALRELVVFYQPRINLASRGLIGVEALARWPHPVKGMIPPAVFIPLAEQYELIDNLTTTVIEQALEQCSNWFELGNRLQLSINMSARTFTHLDFPDRLAENVKAKGLNPSQVIIEVTESSVVKELNQALDILTRLRMKGFNLAIDDFGTGYSSMKQLQSLPFNELKIDQSFVLHADTNQESRAIVETTIDLGRKLNMNVVAEGVESSAVWKLLVELGCDEAQGYFMGKPMPATDLITWKRHWQ